MKVRPQVVSIVKRRIRVMAAGDYFKCASCGYTVRYKVLGDTARCSQCGGTMYRV